jgi:hypothetical protein
VSKGEEKKRKNVREEGRRGKDKGNMEVGSVKNGVK